MSYELKVHLEEISKSGYLISDVYDELIELELNKGNAPDYEQKLTKLLQRLSSLKEEEKEAYVYFEDMVNTVVAIDALSKLSPSSGEKAHLCVDRIQKTLYRIMAQNILKNPEVSPGTLCPTQLLEHLQANGYSELDSIEIIITISLALEKSLDTAVNNIHLHALSTMTDPNVRRLYITRRLRHILSKGGPIEDTLIASRFSSIKNTLNQDIKPLEIKAALARFLINEMIKDSLDKSIKILMTTHDYELYDNAFVSFKASILHLDDTALEQYKTIISLQAVARHYEPKALLNEINYIIDLRKKSKEK